METVIEKELRNNKEIIRKSNPSKTNRGIT